MKIEFRLDQTGDPCCKDEQDQQETDNISDIIHTKLSSHRVQQNRGFFSAIDSDQF